MASTILASPAAAQPVGNQRFTVKIADAYGANWFTSMWNTVTGSPNSIFSASPQYNVIIDASGRSILSSTSTKSPIKVEMQYSTLDGKIKVNGAVIQGEVGLQEAPTTQAGQ